MRQISLRPMTADEFAAFRSHLVPTYAEEKVRAGDWQETDAESRAADDLDQLLPDGPMTSGTLLLVAEDPDGHRVGHVWVALSGPRDGEAWIYDIEVDAEHRGKGYGRALLHAAEQEARGHGVQAMGLHVFGENETARRLYETSGYRTTSLLMRKALDDPAR